MENENWKERYEFFKVDLWIWFHIWVDRNQDIVDFLHELLFNKFFWLIGNQFLSLRNSLLSFIFSWLLSLSSCLTFQVKNVWFLFCRETSIWSSFFNNQLWIFADFWPEKCLSVLIFITHRSQVVLSWLIQFFFFQVFSSVKISY